MLKAEARKVFMELREAMSTTEFQVRSHKLEENLFNHFNWSGKTIATFLSIKAKKEIDTFSINECLEVNNKLLASQSDFSSNTMQFMDYHTTDQLQINKWGIPEPLDGNIIDPKAIDIMLTPLLGFDERGYRVGYGKGFYDRYADQLRPDCILVGLSLFDPIPLLTDINQFDKPLDYCLTPDRVYTF